MRQLLSIDRLYFLEIIQLCKLKLFIQVYDHDEKTGYKKGMDGDLKSVLLHLFIVKGIKITEAYSGLISENMWDSIKR